MVSVLIHNKSRYSAAICVFLLLCTLLFSGCNPRSGKYPFERGSQWHSEKPQMSLNYSQREDGTWDIYETLFYDGEVKEILLDMHSSAFWVYPAPSSHVINHDDLLFSGSWKYRSGNLVLIIEEDFLFNGKYSKIILKPSQENTTP